MIKISIRDITSKGLEIDQTLPKEGLGLSGEEIDLRSPMHIKARIERHGNMIGADAKVEAEFGFLCARCLEEMRAPQTHDYHFDFEFKPGDEYIDLGEEIRQELIMANPARILCKNDCKGICPKCGVNLNNEPCKCK